MTISEYAQLVAGELASADVASMGKVLVSHLARLVGKPYSVESGRVIDSEGGQSEEFAVVVVDSTANQAMSAGRHAADRCAAVIDAVGTLDRPGLEASYRRIAEVKRLRKSARPAGTPEPHTTVTLGIIVAQQSRFAAEELLDELQRLNSEYESREWPDLIAVLTFGVVNYAVQFPAESISGDLLPPAANAFVHSVPPIYVVPVIRPPAGDSFKRLVAFLDGHLAIFAPGAVLPDRRALLDGTSDRVITGAGYQYNRRGQLVLVPEEQYRDKQLPIMPLQIVAPNGSELATVQFVQWQDGGVIVLRGSLPLEALLLLGGRELAACGMLKRRGDVQISNVLPLTKQGFTDLLRKFQSQSNMSIRQPENPWTIQKIGDEGTATPIIGRLYIGVFRMRDVVCQTDEARVRFDELYEVVLSAVMSARATTQGMETLWRRHSDDVNSGKVARVQQGGIQVDESIDKELRTGFESFTNATVRAVKLGLQKLASEFGVELGILFQRQEKFEEGLEAIQRDDPLLSGYLRDTRLWTEPLVALRNDVEHKGWMLPKVTYSKAGIGVVAREPTVNGESLTRYLETTLNRIASCVEELTAYVLSRRMLPLITLTEIAIEHRSASSPERFRITLADGGGPRWELRYSDEPFDMK